MLEDAFLTTSLVLGGAALIVPATRNMFLGSVKRDWLEDELEFDFIDTDKITVHLKSGTMFRVIALKGQPYDTMPLAQQENLFKGRADVIHQIGTTGATARFMGIKRQEDVSFEATYPSPTLEEIGTAEQYVYKNSYITKWYIFLESKEYSLLEKASNKAITILSDYTCHHIKAKDVSQGPCDLTGIMNYLVCGDLRYNLNGVSKNISANISGSNIKFSQDGPILCNTPTEQYHKVVTVSQWPVTLHGTTIPEIMALSGDIEITQIAIPLQTEKTITGLKRKSNEHASGPIGNAQFSMENQTAAEILSANEATFFETQFQIFARAETIEALNSLVKRISEILSHHRIVYSTETNEAANCWFNRIPGNNKLLRPLRLFNSNIAALWAFQLPPQGQNSSPFGNKPIRLFKTPTGQSYSFQFHASDKPQSPGNSLVFGPVGSGKTTFALHLIGGLTKFPGIRNYVFDSNEGARAMIEGLGGIYQAYDNLSLNPLDVGERTKSKEQQIKLVIQAMVGESLSDDMAASIKLAINQAFLLDPPERTFNEIYEGSFARDTVIFQNFAKWITDKKGEEGLYSHVFNAPVDQMSNFLKQSFLVGINMNEALKDPELGAPIVAHISTSIKQAAKTSQSGFSIFVDEAANLLRNRGFRDVVLEMYREYRKLDGITSLAFQDPAALLKFSDKEGIINNTQTLIFFPNSLVRHEDLEPFNLNEEQMNFITNTGTRGGGRHVLIVKRDASSGYEESAILDVDLSYLGKPVRLYRSGAEANLSLDKLKTQHPDNWINHI